jgi:hypothetical protein
MEQVLVVGRWLDLENEQGDRDREDCVAERHQPAGVAVDRGWVGPALPPGARVIASQRTNGCRAMRP